METVTQGAFSFLLHKGGFKATPARLALLEVLAKAKRPLATHDIVKRLAKHSNQATIYRGLEVLAQTGMIRRVDMQHAHAHYELLVGAKHHHHIICTTCHRVEDIEHCANIAPEVTLLQRSQEFTTIESHAIEFFGTCKRCATQKDAHAENILKI